MAPNPFLGVLLHSIGGLAAASFYLPYHKVRHWSWESYWIVGGFFSWIIAPWLLALILVPNLLSVLQQSPTNSLLWTYLFGVLWGIGGLTFGLSMRYLGMSLGYALALGLCAFFGTLIPPIYKGTIAAVVQTLPGWTVLIGILICLAGIAVSGLAGICKERELSDEQKKATIKEFSFVKGALVATFAGVMSACMSFGFAAGDPIAATALQHQTPALWKNLPIWIVVLAGGFTTNFIWCLALNIKNRSASDYLKTRLPVEESTALSPSAGPSSAVALADAPPATACHTVPLLANYLFSAAAGTIWYFQFFFYGMGATQMGKYGFSSWSLHMASIIIFSTFWGILLHEWRGSSPKTLRYVWAGILVLILSMILIGLGNANANL